MSINNERITRLHINIFDFAVLVLLTPALISIKGFSFKVSTKEVSPAPQWEVKGRRAPFCAAKAKHKVKTNNEALGAKKIILVKK